MFRILNLSGSLIKDTFFNREKLNFSEIVNKHGGLCAKFAQAYNLENMNSTVFEKTEPLNPEETNENFKLYLKMFENKIESEEEASWYGSIAQVYRGIYHNSESNEDEFVVMKCKYAHLAKLVDEDMYVLKKVVKLYSKKKSDRYKAVLEDVEKLTHNEQNLKLEIDNVNRIYKIFEGKTGFVIPKGYTNLSDPNGNVIVLQQVMGKRLNHWLSENPRQEKINRIAELMFKFVYTLMNVHSILYTDSHWTNFLVIDNEETGELKLGIVDFGGIIYMPINFSDYRQRFFEALIKKDFLEFKNVCFILNLFDTCVDEKYILDMFNYMICNIAPFLKEKYKFNLAYKNACMKIPFDSINKINIQSNIYGMIRVITSVNMMLCTLNAEGSYKEWHQSL